MLCDQVLHLLRQTSLLTHVPATTNKRNYNHSKTSSKEL